MDKLRSGTAKLYVLGVVGLSDSQSSQHETRLRSVDISWWLVLVHYRGDELLTCGVYLAQDGSDWQPSGYTSTKRVYHRNMTPYEFVSKWGRATLSESAGSQEHFIDICRLVGGPTPAEADPSGDFFTFEKNLKKESGRLGFADVWRKNCFAWEYKGQHADLTKAYAQLQLYREALGNPPLLVVCDFDRYEVHTNFNNTVKRIYRFTNAEVLSDNPVDGSTLTPVQVLRALFEDPNSLQPGQSQDTLTEEAAELLGTLTEDLRKWNEASDEPISDQRIARFVMRMIFCFFAADVGLIPKDAFSYLIRVNKANPTNFRGNLSRLFCAMKDGGEFLMQEVPHFNGGLFDDDFVPNLIADHITTFEQLNDLAWSDIEPSIFGTLFEGVIDKSKRRQLGTHYTSREDIELIVEPVLMRPLRAEWEKVRAKAQPYIDWESQHGQDRDRMREQLNETLSEFQDRVVDMTVLDPACGSGNFLYVSLALLKALEKEVIAVAVAHGLDGFFPRVHPRQLFGIETDEYAHELASAVVWIGYLQWKHRNAFDLTGESPILQPLDNIRLTDALLDFDANGDGKPSEAQWPDADVIIGNPPFLGGKLLRRELGDDYVEALFEVWADRVSREADLCCYWFEKARSQIEHGDARRAGLLSTQGIRGGRNRLVLERIAESGSIFWAQSDREWTLDGAAVQVSMVGFDDGSETGRELDGLEVSEIYTNLRSGKTDVTKARRLKENLGISFQGPVKVGKFDIVKSVAHAMVRYPNPDGRSNRDVVQPWVNGSDITGRPRNMWIINFNEMPIDEASLYESPFEYVRNNIEPLRSKNRDWQRRTYWWRLGRSGRDLQEAAKPLERYIVTPRVSKHRSFVWVSADTLPDSAVIAFAQDDDYFFGILHSRIHELWARSQGTQLREVESGFRYTPTSTFETFPFPEPTDYQRANIANAARHLDTLRQGWLNPPPEDVGASELRRRTLTNLYNDPPTWLQLAHNRLDEAVAAAYDWAPDLADGEIIARLLELNLMREAAG